MIDSTLYTVSGSNISAQPQTETLTDTDNGVNLIVNSTGSGVLGSNTIIINLSVTGTWNESGGISVNLSGSSIITLIK